MKRFTWDNLASVLDEAAEIYKPLVVRFEDMVFANKVLDKIFAKSKAD